MRSAIVVVLFLSGLAAGAFWLLGGFDDGVELASGDPLEALVPPEQAGLTLEGRVLDPQGAPIANAEVFLAPSAQPLFRDVGEPATDQPETGLGIAQVQSLVTRLEAGEGHFAPAAQVVSDAEGRFRFGGLRNVALRVWASAEGHGPVEQDQVTPGAALVLRLSPAQARTLGVVDAAGAALAGAQAWLLSGSHPGVRRVAADGEGRLQLSGLGAGVHTLLVAADGHVPRRVLLDPLGSDGLSIALSPLRSLTVEVFSAGEPADATVFMAPIEEATAGPATERTTVEGRVLLEGIAAPRVLLRAVSGASSSPAVVVSLDDLAHHASLHLTEGAHLIVTPVDGEGRPLGSSRVSLLRQDGLRITGREGPGPVELGPIAPGVHALRIEAEGARTFEGWVRLEKGTSKLEVPIEPLHVIEGVVLDAFGRAVSGARVMSAPLAAATLSDEAGRFRLELAAAGPYVLRAQHPAWGGAVLNGSAPAGDVKLSLVPGAAVSVRVEAADQPVQGAKVRVVDAAGSQTWGRTGPDGSVVIRGLIAGSVRVEASHPAAPELEAAIQTQALAEGATERLTLQLSRRPTASPPMATVSGPGTAKASEARAVVTGRVALADGAKPRFYVVNGFEFTDPSGAFAVPARLAAEGEAAASRLPIQAPGYVGALVSGQAGALDLGVIELVPAPTVTGVVQDARGTPVSGAVVGCDGCAARTMSLHDGSFTLEVPAAGAKLQLFAARGGRFARALAQPAKPATVILETAKELRGVLHGEDGRPAAGQAVRLRGPARTDTVLTGQDGGFRFAAGAGSNWLELPSPPGVATAASRHVWIDGDRELSVGRAPGTGRLAVRAGPEGCWNLGLVRGATPPGMPLDDQLERLDGSRYAARAGALTLFDGLAPGAYALRFEPARHGAGAGSASVSILEGEETTLQAPACDGAP